jgi:hypothetical protein
MPVTIGEVDSTVDVETRGGEASGQTMTRLTESVVDSLRQRLAEEARRRVERRLRPRDQDD